MAMMEHKLKEGAVDVINFILAVFLFLTPWIFGFMSEHTAARNAWVIGVVMGIVAIVALTKFAEWEEWVNLLLGVWVVVSPSVLAHHRGDLGPCHRGSDRRDRGRGEAVAVAATAAPDRASVSRRAGAFPQPLGKPLSSLTAKQ